MKNKKAFDALDPKYYVNSRREVIMRPDIGVQKLNGKYIIFDPSQVDEPNEFMVIGKSMTWEIRAREEDK